MESPLESSNKPRQSSGLRQSPPTSSPGSPALSESSAVIRRRARARPRVPIVQSAAKVFSPGSRPPSKLLARVGHRPHPSARQALSRMSGPRQTTVVRRARPCRPPSPPESPAKFLLKVCQSRPVTARVAQIRAPSPQESRQAVFASAVPLEFRESADARRPSASHTTPKTNLVVHRKFPPGHVTVTHPVINCEQARFVHKSLCMKVASTRRSVHLQPKVCSCRRIVSVSSSV